MTDLTSILRDLADGRIDQSEAQRRIEAARAAAPGAGVPAPPPPRPAEARPTPRQHRPAGDLERLVIRASGRRLRLIGDPEVASVVVSGPHTQRRVGDALEIDAESDLGEQVGALGSQLGALGSQLTGVLGKGAGAMGLLRTTKGLGDLRATVQGTVQDAGRELVVRLNPALVVDLEATAGSLACTAVPRFGHLRITAGAAQLAGVQRVDDALVQAATVQLRGRLVAGRSRVRVESGQLTVTLDEGSDVAVTGEAQAGRISWPGEHGQVEEYVVGSGAARLDLAVMMGLARVRLATQDHATDDEGHDEQHEGEEEA